jgi:Protein of unknown function (DUF2946)
MDEIVARAIAKWPNVPAVYGWLSLDGRGDWSIKGERIRNPVISEFIARNYAHDERGRWFFQNGPQRVFVSLAYTPLVYRTRTGDGLAFVAHTGRHAEAVRQAWLDDRGQLLVESELGIGLLHDQDLPDVLVHLTGSDGSPLADAAIERLVEQAAAAVASAAVRLDTSSGPAPLATIRADAVPQRFHFDPDPRPAPGEPEC